MLNIYIIIPNLKGGGSERVISNLVKYIDKNRFDVTLILGNKIGEYVKDIPVGIRVVDLRKNRVRYAIIPIIKIIKKEKPDIVLSTLGHLNLLIALFRPFLPRKTKFIARESNTISVRNKDESCPWLFDFLFKTVYRNFDLVICQAESMKLDLLTNYNFPSDKTVVINNPIDFKNIDKLNAETAGVHLPDNKYNLLIVGRLSSQKRVDHAIKAMQNLSNEYHLTILGEGELKVQLQQLIDTLNLKEKISLVGFSDNPYSIYSKVDLLLSTSEYEGFPNVVLEANACGLPVVAYNYIGGINEIIVEGINGHLVENGNIRELSKTIINVLKYNNYDKKNIKILTKKRFEVGKIVKSYENEFYKLI
ncbi:glycosyltransferase [Mariniflexile ostreae]|uniref:Glycosyltransferase n=1 Tax=Mariniflexile ostreae TaxID=1520892 RepID=A0ABV5F729_9FLAO